MGSRWYPSQIDLTLQCRELIALVELLIPKIVQKGEIKVFIKLMATVLIYIGDARFTGSSANTHMVHVVRGNAKTVTDIPDRITTG